MIPINHDYPEKGRANRPGYPLKPEYITIHDTANPNPGAGAANHAQYMKSNSAALKQVSWHFVVDDREIFQCLPLTENAWHAGDGKAGAGNRQSIAIEICENSDGDRIKAEDNAAKLTAQLMRDYAIPLENVVQHNHWSPKKNCPHVLRGRPNGWNHFIESVKLYQYIGAEKPEPDPGVLIAFSRALDALKLGKTVRRKTWPDDMKLKLVMPGAYSYITKPYFLIVEWVKIPGTTSIWYPTAEDLLANDWLIKEEK